MKPAAGAGSKFLSIPEPKRSTLVWSIVAIQASSHFNQSAPGPNNAEFTR